MVSGTMCLLLFVSFYHQFLGQILITQTMHISDTFTNQLKGFGLIKKVQSLFIGQACLLSKQFDDTSVLALEENGVCLHRLQCDGFNKLEITVNHLLGGDAELVVGLLPAKSHADFRTPFLFIRSTKSSTMYSREKVCNTS